MDKSLFCYNLPNKLIAQQPANPRDSSRLLVLDKNTGDISDNHFYNILDYVKKGDTLVVNDSKVLPARLLGNKTESGGAVEILLLKNISGNVWECLAKPGKRLKKGARVVFGQDELFGEIVDEIEDGKRIVDFSFDNSKTFFEVIENVGVLPLPHYIENPVCEDDSYQTVYADTLGSAAAPTAGLHFTDELLEKLEQKGVSIAKVTLHVGLGTFRPVKAKDITQHVMHTEHYSISKSSATTIAKTKQKGGRVIAVGTTSCRTLESMYKTHSDIVACEGDTDIFIYPGYKFGVIDCLITNFHLPESSLIMLVSAFAGYDNTMNAYSHAVKNNYRFYSFGDAMFIY